MGNLPLGQKVLQSAFGEGGSEPLRTQSELSEPIIKLKCFSGPDQNGLKRTKTDPQSHHSMTPLVPVRAPPARHSLWRRTLDVELPPFVAFVSFCENLIPDPPCHRAADAPRRQPTLDSENREPFLHQIAPIFGKKMIAPFSINHLRPGIAPPLTLRTNPSTPPLHHSITPSSLGSRTVGPGRLWSPARLPQFFWLKSYSDGKHSSTVFKRDIVE